MYSCLEDGYDTFVTYNDTLFACLLTTSDHEHGFWNLIRLTDHWKMQIVCYVCMYVMYEAGAKRVLNSKILPLLLSGAKHGIQGKLLFTPALPNQLKILICVAVSTPS